MKKHFQYLKYLLRHKWYVFLACLQYGLVWRGIKHDWSKFLPSEWFPYVEYFYGAKVERPNTKRMDKNHQLVPIMEAPEVVKKAFDVAWNYHQKRNSHHWQYWLLTPDNPRPNFTMQSYDGGMTHTYIRSVDGKMDVAIIHDSELKYWKPDGQGVMQLNRDLLNTPIPLDMPIADRKEMLADWRGAGRALGKPDTKAWYLQNRDNMHLHPNTRAWVELMLQVVPPSDPIAMNQLIAEVMGD